MHSYTNVAGNCPNRLDQERSSQIAIEHNCREVGMHYYSETWSESHNAIVNETSRPRSRGNSGASKIVESHERDSCGNTAHSIESYDTNRTTEAALIRYAHAGGGGNYFKNDNTMTKSQRQTGRGPECQKQELYKVRQASEILGVSQVTIRRLIKRGMLIPIKVLRHTLLSAAELRRFIEQGERGPAASKTNNGGPPP